MRIAITLLSLAALSAPASAACFEDIGCTDDHAISLGRLRDLSCENLWYARNSIYHDNGYCFATAKGRESFGNAGCTTHNANAIHLNNYERTNIGRIKQVEGENGCSD